MLSEKQVDVWTIPKPRMFPHILTNIIPVTMEFPKTELVGLVSAQANVPNCWLASLCLCNFHDSVPGLWKPFLFNPPFAWHLPSWVPQSEERWALYKAHRHFCSHPFCRPYPKLGRNWNDSALHSLFLLSQVCPLLALTTHTYFPPNKSLLEMHG